MALVESGSEAEYLMSHDDWSSFIEDDDERELVVEEIIQRLKTHGRKLKNGVFALDTLSVKQMLFISSYLIDTNKGDSKYKTMASGIVRDAPDQLSLGMRRCLMGFMRPAFK